jgi:hypothetical protein
MIARFIEAIKAPMIVSQFLEEDGRCMVKVLFGIY